MARARNLGRGVKKPIGALLKRLREAAGLSQRELARRMGTGVATVSSVEAGRPPRLATLRLFCEHLPGATPRMLLDPTSVVPEPCSRAVGDWLAARFGFSADTVTLRLSPRSWEFKVAGLRSETARDTPALALARAQAVCLGSASFRREMRAETLRGSHEDETMKHVFSEGADGESLDYRCRGRSAHEGSCLVSFPMRELVLDCPTRGAGSAAARVLVFPRGQPPDIENEMSRWVHPAGLSMRLSDDGKRLTVRIPHPFVGARYVLTMDGGSVGARRKRVASLGRVVRRVREDAGLSLRALGREAGLSHRTIRLIEADGDTGVVSLQRLLTALPSLGPQDLLPGVGEPAGDAAGYREHARRFFGIEAREVVKTIDIGQTGARTTAIHTRGLRHLRAEVEEIKVRVGLRKAVLQDSPLVLAALEAGDQDVTTPRMELAGGDDGHVIRLRRQGGRTVFNYTRRYVGGGEYALTDRRVTILTGQTGPHRAGGALRVAYPLDEFRLVIMFPDGYVPIDLRSHEWPSGYVPDEPLMLDSNLPKRFLTTSRRKGRLTARLKFQRPVAGMEYCISWQLP